MNDGDAIFLLFLPYTFFLLCILSSPLRYKINIAEYTPKENDPRIYDDDFFLLFFFFFFFFFSCSTQWWEMPFLSLSLLWIEQNIRTHTKNNNEEKYTRWCRWPCLLAWMNLDLCIHIGQWRATKKKTKFTSVSCQISWAWFFFNEAINERERWFIFSNKQSALITCIHT